MRPAPAQAKADTIAKIDFDITFCDWFCPGSGSDIPGALDAALDELTGPRHRAGAQPVMVFVSDGGNNGPPLLPNCWKATAASWLNLLRRSPENPGRWLLMTTRTDGCCGEPGRNTRNNGCCGRPGDRGQGRGDAVQRGAKLPSVWIHAAFPSSSPSPPRCAKTTLGRDPGYVCNIGYVHLFASRGDTSHGTCLPKGPTLYRDH